MLGRCDLCAVCRERLRRPTLAKTSCASAVPETSVVTATNGPAPQASGFAVSIDRRPRIQPWRLLRPPSLNAAATGNRQRALSVQGKLCTRHPIHRSVMPRCSLNGHSDKPAVTRSTPKSTTRRVVGRICCSDLIGGFPASAGRRYAPYLPSLHWMGRHTHRCPLRLAASQLPTLSGLHSRALPAAVVRAADFYRTQHPRPQRPHPRRRLRR